MIDLYYWATPNGHKISIFLEEAGLPYRIIPINIGQGDQFKPEFLKMSPNNKIPAIVDHHPAIDEPSVSVFESGAILLYLAEKTGQFLPANPAQRLQALQWLFWQVGGLGPMAGQNSHFKNYAPEQVPYAITRYENETGRLYAVLNRQLAGRDYIAGEYSIADMACYPWVMNYDCLKLDISPYPHLQQWLKRIAARPAVQRAFEIPKQIKEQEPLSPEQWARLFAQNANSVESNH